jgi:3-oxoadipate enol-lactonase
MLRSMSLIDCSPKFGFGGGSDPDAFEAWVASELDRKPLATFNEEMIRAIVSPRASEEAVAQAVCAMAPASRSGLELAARLIARHDAMDILPGIARPALVMAGEDDAETPPSYAQAIAARIPNANLSIVRGAGHIANIEAGDAVTARLRTFLTYSI